MFVLLLPVRAGSRRTSTLLPAIPGESLDLSPFTWLQTIVQRVSLLFRGLCAVGILALAGSLFHAAAAPAEPPALPRSQVEAYLKKVAVLSSEKQALVEVATARAKTALKKAGQASRGAEEASGADSPASSHEASALEWVLTAEDTWRAAEQEAEATALEDTLQAARAELSRARALLEETQARKGRLEAVVKHEESLGRGGAEAR
ncbi:MAG: hypothetical protein RJA70_3508 [Pseudomonadota bacterium]|jgi:hypothetical protein